MASDDPWTSPSELADYAYCPRSAWYRRHPPPEGPSDESLRRGRAGTRYHDRALTAEARRARSGWAGWAGLVAGGVLLVAGVAWVLRP